MSTKETEKKTQYGLTPYLSSFSVWAFALGTSIGWGSLVITSNTYLSQAGPLGSVFGLLIGMAVMLVISRNYHYLINRYPDAGGAYAYSKAAFGYDHGFLTAWFLVLTYFAIFWANATSLPLFARYFLGDLFQFGFRYSIFGYEVYLGEIILSVAAIWIIALLCMNQRKAAAGIMTCLVCLLSIAIIICFLAAIGKHGGTSFSFQPAMLPEKNALSQIVLIACISPWAFIGFESISHSSEEFRFPHRKIFRILILSVISATALYLFVMLLSVSAYPAEYASWREYINDIGNLSGIKGLPAFYAAQHYLGNGGILLLILALLALIITSLIGNIVALSRLILALTKDNILPAVFSKINKHQVPGNALILIAVISMFIPFLGRTAVGWIVDVTTLGATVVYGFVSASALKTANDSGDKTEKVTGVIGLIVMVVIALYLLLPNLFSAGSMGNTSYILFTVWSILGFFFFRHLLKKDSRKRFGKSIIVWIVLLSLILFTSLVWMNQRTVATTETAIMNVQEYLNEDDETPEEAALEDVFIRQQLAQIYRANAVSMVIVIGLFGVSLITLLNIYSLMRKRAEQSEMELGVVRTMANTDPLTGVKSKHAYAEKEMLINQQIKEDLISEFSVVVCDVNGLKHINDTLGHKAGDEYIKEASRLICVLFQHSPVFRVGGDEFVVVMTGQDYANRDQIMKQMQEQVEENLKQGKVVVSAGLSDYIPKEDTSIHDVFERADAIMYERKKTLKRMGARVRD